MRVTKEPVCGYCRGDIAAMADKAGLKSLTVYEQRTGKTLYWDPGMKSLKEKNNVIFIKLDTKWKRGEL
ncbi:cytidine deaminase-like fold-containing protein [Cronobacter dublinensis]